MKNLRMILLIIIFLIGGCVTGTMIRTDPPQADVYINKRHIGTSPVLLSETMNEDFEVAASKGEYKADKIIRVEKKKWTEEAVSKIKEAASKISGKGNIPKEIYLTLNGQIEIGAFRIGAQEEKEDLETAMKVLYKLKNPSSTIVIYDASGSMQWPLALPLVEGYKTPRFEPGQKAIVDFIRKANPSDLFGLIVFGHRLPSGEEGSKQRLESCEDIELMIPLREDKDRMINAITALKLKDHRGDTPLEMAIRAATEVLKDKIGEKKIVLVTDGYDECGGRPEKAAKEAARFGIKVHTLAYGIGIIKKKDGKLMEDKALALEIREILKECANAGGGLFFDTKGAEELYRAIIKVELAVFTYTIKDISGKEILKGNLGHKFFLDAGQYEIVFNTDKPFSEKVEVKPAKNTKIFIALSKDGMPEIRTIFE